MGSHFKQLLSDLPKVRAEVTKPGSLPSSAVRVHPKTCLKIGSNIDIPQVNCRQGQVFDSTSSLGCFYTDL